MLIYYNNSNGKLLHTIDGFPEVAPPGNYISVPDGTTVNPQSAFEIVNGVLTEVDIEPIIEWGVNYVNSVSSKIREKFITNITGQEMIYKEKEIEAQDYVAAIPEPNTVLGWESLYPFIAAEVGYTAPTPLEVANVYLGLAQIWRSVGASLESARIGTITGIENSTTSTEVNAAISAFEAAIAAF